MAAGLKPSDFDHVPLLIVNGDYRSAADASNELSRLCRDQCQPDEAAKAEVIDLDNPSFGGKFNGTTHMNMLGTNKSRSSTSC